MTLKITNTLSGKKEEFKPLKTGEVSMYHCGPTVYDSVHIGNLRSFIMNDTIRRGFEYLNYKVNQVMNITDVDDKTIKRSQDEKINLSEFTKKYEIIFLEDITALNILKPHQLLRATDHIQEMINIIDDLIKKDFAYKTEDGIYFKIEKSKIKL